MEHYLGFYETKCAGSKALIEEAKNYIPGGVQHNLAFNYPFPLAMDGTVTNCGFRGGR